MLVLTTFDLDEYVFAEIRAGASGFLVKEATADDLVRAIRTVAEGEALLAPSAMRRLIEAFAATADPAPELRARIAELSPRETEVLRLIARGQSTVRSQRPSCSARRRSSRTCTRC